jgi:sulfide dehydrogenase cytochrome subunit
VRGGYNLPSNFEEAAMTTRLTALALLLAIAGAAAAQDRERLYLRSVAASCAQCHGTDGKPAQGSALPPLAGRPREELIAQLQAFKAGTRPATIMTQLSKGFSDAQIEQIAGHFAAMKN